MTSPPAMSYVGHSLNPPSALSFLRPTPTKSTTAISSYQSSMDVPSSMHCHVSLPTMRRSRAGTMPSFAPIPETTPHRSHSSFLLTPSAESGRHRSGSLNLPAPSLQLSTPGTAFSSPWPNTELGRNASPRSPSTEQLLQNDHDFSIARTLRSLGLEEESRNTAENNGLFHQQTPAEFHLASRSLLSANRSRSYSVNATARYQENISDNSRSRASSVSKSYVSPLEGFSRQQNRPRASSMGRMDAARSSKSPMMMSSLWQMQRSSPLALREEEFEDHSGSQTPQTDSGLPLSLGDSELLANMLQKQGRETSKTESVTNGNGLVEPYLHFSQSTPTFRDRQVTMTASTSSTTQAATRSLWIGNIDASVTVEIMTQMFSAFGPIESVRLLLEKECAFVNFFHVEDAVRAKEEVLGRLGGKVGNCIVRIGYGKADAAVPEANASQPTRALWLGNIPSSASLSVLQRIFSSFGTIESVRILSHKNCAFINFEYVESASAARDALLRNDISTQGFAGVRVGFAKVPPAKSSQSAEVQTSSSKLRQADKEIDNNNQDSWFTDLWHIMKEFDADDDAKELIRGLQASSGYFQTIPPVPELGVNRKLDAGRLRDMRKRLDNANLDGKEADSIAIDCMEEIAELSSDYIGNTVVQRLFEKCSESIKMDMLKRIAPHLAAISIHKNGTWASQKIIDTVNSPDQIRVIAEHLRPYVPSLLLDQFGNYAVQCCLRLGDTNNQFVFDSMVLELLSISQGRFGARAMRGTLESQYVTPNQKKLVAAALAQSAPSLATNANGALLLSWLIDSSDIQNRLQVVACRLIPQLTQLCTHKLGSQIIFKLLHQTEDLQAQEIIFNDMMNNDKLEDILSDQARGVTLIQKIITSNVASAHRQELQTKVREMLESLNGPGHKKLLDELIDLERKTVAQTVDNP
ncbi:hypothetical protein EC973_007049 [Apophysomyces ossiformis]|uniref:ARM repeat-containing protein n=1 Tax=Apophysomyces ossiformis TaxID=679940 RepID=A0A8H7ERX9_9FUNG|nr:hypothetical protein EC973_007049 [Apophysomyces ossiformis]